MRVSKCMAFSFSRASACKCLISSFIHSTKVHHQIHGEPGNITINATLLLRVHIHTDICSITRGDIMPFELREEVDMPGELREEVDMPVNTCWATS